MTAGLVLVPALSVVFGNGSGPTFTMYASMVNFRLAVVGRALDGRLQSITPASLASALPRSARPFVMGAEHVRHASDVSALRHHLDDLARIACRVHPALAETTVTLVEEQGASTRHTEGHARCSP